MAYVTRVRTLVCYSGWHENHTEVIMIIAYHINRYCESEGRYSIIIQLNCYKIACG